MALRMRIFCAVYCCLTARMNDYLKQPIEIAYFRGFTDQSVLIVSDCSFKMIPVWHAGNGSSVQSTFMYTMVHDPSAEVLLNQGETMTVISTILIIYGTLSYAITRSCIMILQLSCIKIATYVPNHERLGTRPINDVQEQMPRLLIVSSAHINN